MFEKTPTTLLDRLGSAIITAIAIRTSITAYSTVVTPFCHLRFASGIESDLSFVSVLSLDFTRMDLLVLLKEPESNNQTTSNGSNWRTFFENTPKTDHNPQKIKVANGVSLKDRILNPI